MEGGSDDTQVGELDELFASALNAEILDAGHLAIATWNGKTGADSKTGVKHLYSAAYRERWPQDEYPELYQEDVPVD